MKILHNASIILSLILFVGCSSNDNESDVDVEQALEVLDERPEAKAHEEAVMEDLKEADEDEREEIKADLEKAQEERKERVADSPVSQFVEAPETLAPHLQEKLDEAKDCDGIKDVVAYFKRLSNDQVCKEIRSDPKYKPAMLQVHKNYKALKKKCGVD